jgi:hypothetical protein
MLVHGSRGAGKSFGAALTAHLDSIVYRDHGTRILGGSLAQSMQIYTALEKFGKVRPEMYPFTSLTKTSAKYQTGSDVAILAASEKMVRGPHVPRLFLDEVDEIEDEIRDHASGIPMAANGVSASIVMLSTWHRVAGPMAMLMKKARDGAFRHFSFCVFDVLERCPDERSGPDWEECPKCPLVKWCHDLKEGEEPMRRRTFLEMIAAGIAAIMPKAKRSNGHYTIDDTIQKADMMSTRVFESDILCLRPKSAGQWFTQFDRRIHVTEDAEYNRGLMFHVPIDPGVHTGAVWFQPQASHDRSHMVVNVFGDYYQEDESAENNALAIVARTSELTGMNTQYARVSMDPAANQRSPFGITMRGEYERSGCVGRKGKMELWPSGQSHPKADGLTLIESLLMSASGQISLRVHPRCEHLITAMESYIRAQRDNQWMDYAKDPQHPHEEMIDSLAGGLKLEYPKGRTPKEVFQQYMASNLF